MLYPAPELTDKTEWSGYVWGISGLVLVLVLVLYSDRVRQELSNTVSVDHWPGKCGQGVSRSGPKEGKARRRSNFVLVTSLPFTAPVILCKIKRSHGAGDSHRKLVRKEAGAGVQG
jgi:hypothetical protein